mmetsp:Transcript_29556/g.45048  ORF Transcript_29556/g.45048 Transcript_29556/m.45048 type:complete len:86 (+) Transcript_29556:465-722(+)
MFSLTKLSLNSFNRDPYELHLKQCPFQPTYCKYCFDMNQILRDVKHHETTCPQRRKRCELCDCPYFVKDKAEFEQTHDCKKYLFE